MADDDHTPIEDETPTTEQPAAADEQPTETVDAVEGAGEPAAERDAALGARTASGTTTVTRERWLDRRSISVAAVSVVLLGGAFALGYVVGDHDGDGRSGGRDGRGGAGMRAFGGGNGGHGGMQGGPGRQQRGEGGWGARGEGFGGRGGQQQRGDGDLRGGQPGLPDAPGSVSAAPAPGGDAPAAPAAPGGTTGTSDTSVT